MKRSTHAALVAVQGSGPDKLTLAQLAARLGLKPSATGLLSDVINKRDDHVSWRSECVVREALGLSTKRVQPTVHLRPETKARLRASKKMAKDVTDDETINRLLDLESHLDSFPDEAIIGAYP